MHFKSCKECKENKNKYCILVGNDENDNKEEDEIKESKNTLKRITEIVDKSAKMN